MNNSVLIIDDDKGLCELLAEYLRRMEHETERPEDLISRLLSSQPLQTALDTHIDLRALLEELCADANFEGEQYRHRVKGHCHPPGPGIKDRVHSPRRW